MKIAHQHRREPPPANAPVGAASVSGIPAPAITGGGHTGSEYIVPTRTGKPYTSEGFRACWQRVRVKWERSGGEPLHFHDIRALAATKCPTLEMAQQLLGHTSPAMTRRVYRRGVERVKPLRLAPTFQLQTNP